MKNKVMTPEEEKVFAYSISSFLVNFLVIPFYMISTEKSDLVEKIVFSICLISSIVFYSLAMSNIRKMKKNAYYGVSISFLIMSSLFYLGVLVQAPFFQKRLDFILEKVLYPLIGIIIPDAILENNSDNTSNNSSEEET